MRRCEILFCCLLISSFIYLAEKKKVPLGHALCCVCLLYYQLIILVFQICSTNCDIWLVSSNYLIVTGATCVAGNAHSFQKTPDFTHKCRGILLHNKTENSIVKRGIFFNLNVFIEQRIM